MASEVNVNQKSKNVHRALAGSNFTADQLIYPEDLTDYDQGHFVQFFIIYVWNKYREHS